MPDHLPPEQFTDEERAALQPYFTNVDRPVFAVVNLPEVVKGAMFARYSRSPKSLRRLFLDEFHEPAQLGAATVAAGSDRADKLYARVFADYGDDSVAQLGSAHLACEDASNLLTKVLEWGRLMAYLEQSTRYIPYTAQTAGRWRYVVPDELRGHPLLPRYTETLDHLFTTYARWIEPLQELFRDRYPQARTDSDAVYRAAIRAKALDTVRGLLPIATRSNVGLHGTGQAFEALLLRMRAHPLGEVRGYAALMLEELRKVIPAFLTRVDLPERGGVWADYLARTRDATAELAARLASQEPEARPEVVLTEFDPEGEVKVVAAALYAHTSLPDDQLLEVARGLSNNERLAILQAAVGDRQNRRHRPGRAFERTSYRFDILTDYGAFRDLQRHRMLTIDWQRPLPANGHTLPEAIVSVGAQADWDEAIERSARLHDQLATAGMVDVAQYALCMAFRIRFVMHMNAREAMHVIELRTAPQGHPAYRRVCQAMHDLIRDQAGHRAIAESMRFADHSEVELERLQAERAAEARRLRRS